MIIGDHVSRLAELGPVVHPDGYQLEPRDLARLAARRVGEEVPELREQLVLDYIQH